MTDLQERMMELVDEIDGICKKLGLAYILGEKTSGTAVLKGGFLGDESEFNIHMSLYDAVKLKQYTLKHLNEQRAIETWAENGSLKRLMFRYVDKNSLLIDEARGEYYKYPGIAVTIHIARSLRPDTRLYACECYLMKANIPGEEPKDLVTPFRLRKLPERLKDKDGKEFAKKQYRRLGRDGLGAFIEEGNEGIQTKEGSRLWHLTMKGKWISLPDRLFEDIRRIPFEGRMLPVTEHMEEYMKVTVGKKWKERCTRLYASVSKNNAIAECNLPYEEYLEYTKDDPVSLEMLINERKQYKKWKEKDYETLAEKVRLDFRKVRASQVRIDLWYDLRSRKEALKEAYEKGDVEAMAALLKEYLSCTDKFYADKLGFFIDDTLLDYADMVWKSRGKQDYRQKVYELVPDQWKKTDLETEMAQYLL